MELYSDSDLRQIDHILSDLVVKGGWVPAPMISLFGVERNNNYGAKLSDILRVMHAADLIEEKNNSFRTTVHARTIFNNYGFFSAYVTKEKEEAEKLKTKQEEIHQADLESKKTGTQLNKIKLKTFYITLGLSIAGFLLGLASFLNDIFHWYGFE